jgi:hypothetical protein
MRAVPIRARPDCPLCREIGARTIQEIRRETYLSPQFSKPCARPARGSGQASCAPASMIQ